MSSADGMNRKIDELGRLVIPIEWRKQLGINANDELSIRKQGRQLIITKTKPNTCTCGGQA